MRPVTSTIHTSLAELRRGTAGGALAGWSALVDADPFASFFQRPEWCLSWYEAYASRFSPVLLAVRAAGELVGVVSLASEVGTRRLVFAGNTFADYRDVVAPDPWRTAVLDVLMRFVVDGHFAEPFVIGYTQPESPTVPILMEGGRPGWPRGIRRSHPCNRLMFDADGSIVRELLAKQSIRRHLNYYRKHGGLELERVRDMSRWDEVRQVFFDHHSLRQIAVGRPVSFTDPAKQAFFSTLLRTAPTHVHFTILLNGPRIVAEHFGFISRGQILLGAPAFDPLEERRAPAQLLLALIAEQGAREGATGLDLTIGESSFKERFGNQTLQLPSIALYRSPVRFLLRRSRDVIVAEAKRRVMRRGGIDRWDELVNRVSGPRAAREKVPERWWSGAAWELQWHLAPQLEPPGLRMNESPDLLHCVEPVASTSELLRRVSSRRREGDALMTVQEGNRTLLAALVHTGDAPGADDATLTFRLLTRVPDDAAAALVSSAIRVAAIRAGIADGATVVLLSDVQWEPLARRLASDGWSAAPARTGVVAEPSSGEAVA